MKKITIISLAVMLSAISLFAQTDEMKYRRSSLAMIMIESDDFPDKDAVMESWNNYPFPDKYNEHDIDLKSININARVLTDQDLMNEGYLLDTLDNQYKILKAVGSFKPIKYLNADSSLALVLPTEKQKYQIKIDQVINEKGLAKQVVSTWFNKSADGKFDMSLIQERGFYNASDLEAGIAQGNEVGLASLGDAGEELLKNTFVTFTKLNFIENEPAAAYVRDIAKETILESMAGSPQMMIDKALAKADKLYEATKEGYTLLSKTWLYRLCWSDSIATIFYTNMWSNPNAFNESDLFSLEYVGVQYNQSLVTFKIGEKRTEAQVIDLTLVRNIDKAFAKLQKKNDVFKPIVPVLTSDPITAKIGMKDGIEGGEEFEVMEMIWNKKTGKTKWKKIGSCKVDKKAPIWDNRYNAGEDEEVQNDKAGNPINATTFKGAKNIQPGMLLKQIK